MIRGAYIRLPSMLLMMGFLPRAGLAVELEDLSTLGRCRPDMPSEQAAMMQRIEWAYQRLDEGDAAAAVQLFDALSRQMSATGMEPVMRIHTVVGHVRAWRELGQPERAWEILESFEYEDRPCALEARAQLLVDTDPSLARQALFSASQSLFPSDAADSGRMFFRYIQMLSEENIVAAARALNVSRHAIDVPTHLDRHPEDVADVMALATALWEYRWHQPIDGERLSEEEAVDRPDLLLDWVRSYGSNTERLAAEELEDEVRVVRDLESSVGVLPGWGLGGEFRREDEVRRLMIDDRLDLAVVAAREFVETQPGAESFGLLAEVHRRQLNGPMAEHYFALAAEAELIPGYWTERWLLDGDERSSGGWSRERRVQVLRAVDAPQPHPEILVRLAEIHRVESRPVDARELLERARERTLDMPYERTRLLRDIDLALATVDTENETIRAADVVPQVTPEWETTVRHLRVAWSFALMADGERATRILSFARSTRPPGDYPVEEASVLAVEGGIHWLLGERAEAVRAWRSSLELDASQRSVWLSLGRALLSVSDRVAAREAFLAAGELGKEEAWLFLATMALSDSNWDEVVMFVERFRANSIGGREEEIRALLGSIPVADSGGVEAGWRWEWTVAGVSGLFFLGLLSRRRRNRCDLDALVEAVPDIGHDIARIISAIRHEVLKHNTTLLDELADALENGDHHSVSFGSTRVFGMPDDPKSGIPARLDGYVQALRRLARRNGRRLDIESDPILGPMCRAMKALRRLEKALRRPWTAGPRVPSELRQLSRQLNVESYTGLGKILRRVCRVWLDADFLGTVQERVFAEPGMAESGSERAEIRVPEARLPVRIYHGDLQDIIANLLRNAIRAGVESDALGISIRVEEEEDPITGFEFVAVRVLDRAPDRLKTASLSGREIGRGLGLTMDLVARHDGTLLVEHREDEIREGWTKALVLRLRRLEMDEASSIQSDEGSRYEETER